MAEAFQVLLFGDETGDFQDPLQKLCGRQKGVLFLHFIDRLNHILHDEVRRHPRHVKKQIPPFTDIIDLVKQYQDSASRNPIFETTLACICQLGSIIGFFDDHPAQHFVPSDTVLVGLCTGLLAAAAVSASQSALELVDNALNIVRVAFRIGIKVNDAAQRLSTETNQRWSRLVLGAQKEASIAEIRRFNERKAYPQASHAYLSSSSRDVVTISGPPSTLKALLIESEFFRERKTVPLDIFGPFHASHLYSDVDVEEVLQPMPETTVNLPSPSIRLISGTKETSLSDMGLDQLLRQVVRDILVRPLSFDNVLTMIISEARDSGRDICKISSVGPSNALPSLVSTLRAETKLAVSVGEQQFGLKKLVNDSSCKSGKIAVVGMSGRFPNADNLESLWSLLEQGLDVHRKVPPDRFDVDAHYDPTGKRKNTTHTPYGCFIEEPGLFDPRFFNVSPREAYQTDPMGRLALVTAYEALEMSGFVPNRTPSSTLNRVGTFYGQTSDDWGQVNAAQNIDTYYIPGTIRAFASGRINYHFKFSGPSYNVDTACSSSFAAIQLACTSLQAKECDTAVAGGLNIMTTPDLFAGLSRGQFLSKTGSCKTFDDTADGYCRGDGVATVILKRLEDAEADNDPILGVILGTATNHSSEAVSITHPHAPTQEFLYKKILRDTGVDPRDISYVEMHGTGTQAGDGAEMRSISNVFAPRVQGRLPGQTVHVGALKANIGHGEASAGVASLVKVLLMLQRNAIPPHVGIKGIINTTFPTDLEERGIRIALKQTSWLPPTGGKRRAYLNNFSAAGGNTGMLLEDAPKFVPTRENDPRTTFVVSVTAKSAWSLEMNIHKLLSYLEMNPDTSLPTLSYTTTARRTQQPFRISFAVSSISEATESLRSAQAEIIKPVSIKPPKVAFVFTGQGAHYPSLGKQLFDNSRQFRSDILDFDKIGRSQGFASFLPLLDGTITDAASFSPLVLQLGQTCIQMALARLWISWGISPSVVIGHSLGEYAALNVAGVLSISDTIFLVGQRAELLEKHCTAGTHSLLAAAASMASTSQVMGGDKPNIACVNGPRETVISGPTEQLMSYSKSLKAAGIKSVLLPCAYAFHSAQVTPILESFKESARSVPFANAAIPVISPLLQEVVTGEDIFGPEYLARHARETVNFLGGITAAKREELVDPNTVWVEIGPTPVCSAFIKSSLGTETVIVPSLHKKEDPWRTTSSGLSLLHRKGLHIDWDEVHGEYESSHVVLGLPSYTFENKNYWLDYTNNWCLIKGEVLEKPTERRRARGLSTSSVHKLTKEDYGGTIRLVAESDLSDPDLNDAIFGHLINGSALCPSGVYADMALTIAGYLHKKVNRSVDYVPMNVRQLEIKKPLIAKGQDAKEEQVLRITATAKRPLGLVEIEYNSISRNNSVGELHALCKVEYGNAKSWLLDWSRFDYLFRSRIDVLFQGADVGKYNKVNREQAYEAFSSLVQYDKKYHGMKQVILDSKKFEASSLIEFRATERDGDFETSPYWIDNIAHLSGFILNGSDAVDSKKQVYISHGWESLQMLRPLSARKSYRNHVRMFQGPGKTMVGDVHVFDGDDMVALVGGVKFQAIPRSLLNRLLPPTPRAAAYLEAQALSTSGIAGNPESRQSKVEKKRSGSVVNEKPQQLKTSISHPPKGNGTSSVVTKFMSIIREELGVETSELTDEAAFADVGLDSLMSLTITGRMREELEMEVPTSLFSDTATVGAAKSVILALDGDDSNESVSMESVSVVSAVTADALTGANITENTSIGSGPAKNSAEDTTEKVLGIISEELGIEQSELLEMGNFADMGVDSLMSLTITGRIREELGVDVPTSFFAGHPDITNAKMAISALIGTNSSGSATPSSYTEDTSPGETDTPASMPNSGDDILTSSILEIGANKREPRSATSILLSGSPKASTKTLFLFPDGSGSATSYALLPSISPDVCVYGLNCPFMKTPTEYTNGIDGVSAQYLAEVKRRQPHGPYYLGGWSAGGVIAYQVAYKLLQMGEKTERLFLIDSPCPIDLEPLPSSLLHFLESTGLLGTGGSPPDWLIPHFEASIANLAAYKPCLMDSPEVPKTLIIWARDGLCKNPEDHQYERSAAETKSVKFLLDNRRDFESYGWDKLLGEENITTATVQGNHFTMIREPVVKEVAALLRRGLGVQ